MAPPDTALRASTPSPGRATPADAFAAAREVYLAGERLDMRELANRLGVGRSTLYRWCADRGQLLTDVIWSITEERIRAFEAATEGMKGKARLREGVRLFLEASANDEALRAFLANESHAALRVMTVRGDGRTQHDRLVAEVTRLIVENDIEVRAAPELVAFTIVRVMEGFVYNDTVAAVDPRLDDALEVLDFLLA
jgi:AcrR family transcriptional regulator